MHDVIPAVLRDWAAANEGRCVETGSLEPDEAPENQVAWLSGVGLLLKVNIEIRLPGGAGVVEGGDDIHLPSREHEVVGEQDRLCPPRLVSFDAVAVGLGQIEIVSFHVAAARDVVVARLGVEADARRTVAPYRQD